MEYDRFKEHLSNLREQKRLHTMFLRLGDLKRGAARPTVESRQVIPGDPESANGWLGTDTAMSAMPVVARDSASAALRGVVGSGIGPFAQGGVDEALSLSVGSGRVGLGEDVLNAEPLAGLTEGFRSIAGAVGGHDPLDGDAEACAIGDLRLDAGDGAALALALS